MHLLYLDDSGAVADPAQPYFVLAGVSVFERRTHWIEKHLNGIAARFDPDNPSSIELHGSPMRNGKGVWRRFKPEDRLKAVKDALKLGIAKQQNGVTLFGVVVKKQALAGEQDPVEFAFEQISSRFDLYLTRLYRKFNNPQRGIILFDKSSTETRIQSLARDFKHQGHTWGTTRNYAEVPVFLDSRASRLIQLADLVAFALYRFHAHNDNLLFTEIKYCFDSEGGVEHGLYVRV